MNADRAHLVLLALAACTVAGFIAGYQWRKGGALLKSVAVFLFILGMLLFFLAACTE